MTSCMTVIVSEIPSHVENQKTVFQSDNFTYLFIQQMKVCNTLN